VTKTPVLSALLEIGGRVGRSDRAGAGEKLNRFCELGNMKWVDHHNHRGCVLLSPLHQIRLQESSPKYGDVNSIAD